MTIPIFIVILLAFYLAWNLGANDVANAMGTSVGSKAVTLKQALIIAGILEFSGAVLFGHEVSQTLATEITNPAIFADAPQVFATGMLSVLLASAIWLQIATSRGLPVSSSHAVVGAIAGFCVTAAGFGAVKWSSIGMITLGWIITPVISGCIAALFYSQIKRWILEQPQPLRQLNEWIPWLSVLLLGVFGVIVLPKATQPLATFLIEQVGFKIPSHDVPLFIGTTAAVGLTVYSWRELRGWGDGEMGRKITDSQLPTTNSQSQIQNPIEGIFGKFQLLSACFVAFAHGSNDVGNAIAPLAAITYVNRTGKVPIYDLDIPLWILVIGGTGIVFGLAVWGKKVIATIGESIIALQPSSGFCAELATATTVILASRLGLPVSTSHALVGGVVGIGIIKDIKSVQFKTLQGIAAAWIITLPVSAVLSAVIFSLVRLVWQ
ncbi:inorganic phosphate transporter [Plectonema cf. radiosum LEGE 06105]|uniref:Phosphate transporter n=1 Tax=Plectonema cf. radiosum LEGE 06105 TaxID=945769 RepID=A0A8J7F4L1_9CYAN|nr:inorganic phosphate transporter [Plectonema radiosum]MBE9216321.1 inorganic phosphate transporter [Plectonema cf. radiosum LEGE 06105]